MTHNNSKVKVFHSTDYKLFTTMDGNRPINKKKNERIIREIESGNDILAEVPILVREAAGNKLEVIDGQHRLEISKALKRPVHYIVHAEKMSLHKVAKINSNVEKWKDTDFINCYIKAGNNHYKRLQQFKDTYSMAVGCCLVLLDCGSLKGGGQSANDKLRQEFETGLFEIKKMKEATIIAEICKEFAAFAAWNSRSFIVAICKLLEKGVCDFERLQKKFQRDTNALKVQRNFKEYLQNLEMIYNLDNQKRVNIF